MRKSKMLSAAALAAGAMTGAGSAQAQERYVGEIYMTAGNWCPIDSQEANGQLIQVSENQILYAVIGNTYGGTAGITFALPDLRGLSPVHIGQGLGLSAFALGQRGGREPDPVMLAPVADPGAARPQTMQTARPPYLALRFCIVTTGHYPSRN